MKVRTKLGHISQMNGLCARFISLLKYKSTVVFYKKDRDGYLKQLQFFGKPPNLCHTGRFSDLSGAHELIFLSECSSSKNTELLIDS